MRIKDTASMIGMIVTEFEVPGTRANRYLAHILPFTRPFARHRKIFSKQVVSAGTIALNASVLGRGVGLKIFILLAFWS